MAPDDQVPREFELRNHEMIDRMGADPSLAALTREWFQSASRYEYSYHFTWMGRPIIQFPQDILAMQEIIWRLRPDVVIETGIAHGGSLLYYASLLELIGSGQVIGIDIEIRPHNKRAIEEHPMSRRVTMLEGSSTDPGIVKQVHRMVAGKNSVLVALDSNHTAKHVSAELDLYSNFVTIGSYVVVFDTIIDLMPENFSPNRPWAPGNSPMTAVHQFLERNDNFEIDRAFEKKLLISAAPSGYLRRIR